MQDDILNITTSDEQPLNSKAYWIQGLMGGVWKNLKHYPTGEDAIDHIGSYVGSKQYSELRLVSATYSNTLEKVDYKLLASIANGNVIRHDNQPIIEPVINDPAPMGTLDDSLDQKKQVGLYAPSRLFDKKNSMQKKRKPFLWLALSLMGFIGIGGGYYYLYGPNIVSTKAYNYANHLYESVMDEYMISAIQKDNMDLLDNELKRGLSPDTTDFMGNSALAIATYENHSLAITKLLKAGANPDSKTIHGTALLLSYVGENNSEMVQTLISYGADLNTAHPDAPCKTALSRAKDNNFDEIKMLLIENGASENLGGGCDSGLTISDDGSKSQQETPAATAIKPILSKMPEPKPLPQLSESGLLADPLVHIKSDGENAFSPADSTDDDILHSLQNAYDQDKE